MPLDLVLFLRASVLFFVPLPFWLGKQVALPLAGRRFRFGHKVDPAIHTTKRNEILDNISLSFSKDDRGPLRLLAAEIKSLAP